MTSEHWQALMDITDGCSRQTLDYVERVFAEHEAMAAEVAAARAVAACFCNLPTCKAVEDYHAARVALDAVRESLDARRATVGR